MPGALRRPRLFLLFVALCAITGSTLFVILRIRGAKEGIADQYAGLQSCEMLIHFVATHDGRWPQKWDDLLRDYEWVARRGEDYCTFHEIKRRVRIDVNLTPNDLQLMAHGIHPNRCHFLRLNSGRKVVWCDVDLNMKIRDYLRTPYSALQNTKYENQ